MITILHVTILRGFCLQILSSNFVKKEKYLGEIQNHRDYVVM